MDDDVAKGIIRAYQLGQCDLSSYVRAIEYCAEKYPDMTMIDILNWSDESVYICDPEKNVDCTKTGCHINGGSCYLTLQKKYKKEDSNDQG